MSMSEIEISSNNPETAAVAGEAPAQQSTTQGYDVAPMSADAAGGDQPTPPAPETPSFIETLYNAINNAVGGDSKDQFLCLTIPGQALTAKDYAYDYNGNAPKGVIVEANESKLANKLFSPSRTASGDNGLTLPYQYRSALDMLSPKLNRRVAEAKNSLRRLLMTPYSYDFGDGNKTYTLQEVYFRLYDEWVSAQQNWATEQSEAKARLGDGSNKYLEWYETVADSRMSAVDEKMSKVISVFTPNDMKILEGILDSGSGAELQEARQLLLDIRKRTPDGGYVYPVKLYPTNWFELLNTSFTPSDLLKDPDALAEKMRMLSTRRLELNEQIESTAKLIPSTEELDGLKKDIEKAKQALYDNEKGLISKYTEGAKSVINMILDLSGVYAKNKVPEDLIKKTAKGKIPEDKIKDFMQDLSKCLSESAAAQLSYINAAGNLAECAEREITGKAYSALSKILEPLRTQLAKVNAEIEDLKMQIQISSAHRTAEPEKDKDGKYIVKSGESAVASTAVPDGYTKVFISQSAKSVTKKSENSSFASQQSWGVHFFFGGYSSHSDKQSSHVGSFTDAKDSSIDIGMNVAKVGIEREWFNPGVFALTKDMFRLSSAQISPPQPYDGVTDERLTAMGRDCVFPCYPVALLIARDISVRFSASEALSSDFSDAVSNHASSGGGFFLFSGSKSSSSSSEETGVSSQSTANTITLRFTTPQIIGYYLQCTPTDYSTEMTDKSDSAVGFTTISQFVDSYKRILEEIEKNKDGKKHD